MADKMLKIEQNLLLAATYLKMNEEGRDSLDMVIKKLSEINEWSYKKKDKDFFNKENERKK